MENLFYKKTLGCLLGGLIGDAIGTPSEGKHYKQIEETYGWIDDFSGDGTDDTVMKNLLSEALIRSDGFGTLDDWARVWLDNWAAIFGEKAGKFFPSVLHTAAKLRQHSVPRMAALGNMPSSSSAMCISPVGIVNACDPAGAAGQAYNLAAMIHTHDVAYCQDGAAAIAAATAQAFCVDTSIEEITATAYDAILAESGAEMRQLIKRALDIANETRDLKTFRDAIYEQKAVFFRRIACDSRETVPITLALFRLSGGDVEKAVTYAANFGRDADTIASMCGAIAGAYSGIDAIKPEWVEKAKRVSAVDLDRMAERLIGASLKKHAILSSARDRFAELTGGNCGT